MISVDDLETNTRFAKEHEADYPILSDATKEVAKAYGVLGASGFASRWTFYIAPDGKILHIDKSVKPAVPLHPAEAHARRNPADGRPRPTHQ